jgi:hypothetical protein
MGFASHGSSNCGRQHPYFRPSHVIRKAEVFGGFSDGKEIADWLFLGMHPDAARRWAPMDAAREGVRHMRFHETEKLWAEVAEALGSVLDNAPWGSPEEALGCELSRRICRLHHHYFPPQPILDPQVYSCAVPDWNQGRTPQLRLITNPSKRDNE